MLTSQAVDAMMLKCLFKKGEPKESAVEVKAIVNTYCFHSGRIAENADAISVLLAELPNEFQSTGGGGWSFLQACVTKTGKQWTDMHRQQERLFALGIAAGKARWLTPRDMWPALPGGMPYVSVN